MAEFFGVSMDYLYGTAPGDSRAQVIMHDEPGTDIAEVPAVS